MTTFTLRDHMRQARADAAVDEARYAAMLPFATHVLDDELVFASVGQYTHAIAAADKAEAVLRRTPIPSKTPPVPK